MHKSQWWSLPTGVRGKAVPVHAMKAYRGSKCVAPVIPNFGSRWG